MKLIVFAITYHRKLREASSLESELDMIVGLGEKRKKEILKVFPDIDAIRSSTVEEIMKRTGFHRVLSERIHLQLNEEEVIEALDSDTNPTIAIASATTDKN